MSEQQGAAPATAADVAREAWTLLDSNLGDDVAFGQVAALIDAYADARVAEVRAAHKWANDVKEAFETPREAELEAEVARLAAERDALREALQQCVDHERINALKYEQTYGTDALHGDQHIERAIIALAGPPPAATLHPEERDALIRSVVSSQALSGVVVTREKAERLLDDVLKEPLVDMGEAAPPAATDPPA